MPLNRLQESLAAAFKTLKEICATESHQPFSGPGEVRDYFSLSSGWGFMWALLDIISQSIPRKSELVYTINDWIRVKESILVVGIFVVDFEFNRPGIASRKVRACAVRKG